jgi:hypothetical protein
MVESLLNFCSEEDKKKLLNFRSPKLSPVHEVNTAQVNVETPQSTPKQPEAVQICEFIHGFIYEGSSGRLCIDGIFCPVRIYGNLALFQVCTTRLNRLKERKKKQEDL